MTQTPTFSKPELALWARERAGLGPREILHNSSSPQQHSSVLSTLLPYHITGIENISLRYPVSRSVIIERSRRTLESTSARDDNLPSADKIDIAVEKLKNIGLVKSADYINYLRSPDDLEAGDQPLTAESAIGFAELMYRFRDLG